MPAMMISKSGSTLHIVGFEEMLIGILLCAAHMAPHGAIGLDVGLKLCMDAAG